jgi:putative membrane protein
VPAGFWVQEWFGLERNSYDKLGHLAQGFVPALVTRELLLRYFRLPRRWITGFLAVCVCLAISAFYELIEWWAALLYGAGAAEFLATQGYEWDTQADMLYALVGAIVAIVFFSRAHDRSMARVTGKDSAF